MREKEVFIIVLHNQDTGRLSSCWEYDSIQRQYDIILIPNRKCLGTDLIIDQKSMKGKLYEAILEFDF